MASEVRSQIVGTYDFSRQTTVKAITNNITLSATLLKGAAFHYKVDSLFLSWHTAYIGILQDPFTLTGYAQHKIISEILHLCWFDDTNSQGIIFSRFYNPISLNILALIFAMVSLNIVYCVYVIHIYFQIDHCLNEWSTGKHVRADFSEKLSAESYHAYVADLKTWNDLNKPVVDNIRKKYYLRAR